MGDIWRDEYPKFKEEAEKMDQEELGTILDVLRDKRELISAKVQAYEEGQQNVRIRKMIDSGILSTIRWKLVFGDKMETCWLKAQTEGYEPKEVFDMADGDHDSMYLRDEIGTVLVFDDGDLTMNTDPLLAVHILTPEMLRLRGTPKPRRPVDTAEMIRKYNLTVDTGDIDKAVAKLEEDAHALRVLRDGVMT